MAKKIQPLVSGYSLYLEKDKENEIFWLSNRLQENSKKELGKKRLCFADIKRVFPPFELPDDQFIVLYSKASFKCFSVFCDVFQPSTEDILIPSKLGILADGTNDFRLKAFWYILNTLSTGNHVIDYLSINAADFMSQLTRCK